MLRYSSHPLRRMAMYPLFIKPNQTSKRFKHYDLLNHIEGTLAFLNFNNPTQYNVLNSSTLQTLERTLKSVDADSDIRAAVLAGGQGSFSAGADYLYLAKAYAEGKEADNAYLKTLNKTMYEASKIETPILHVLTGRTYGAAAVLAALSPYTLTTPYTRIKFPETGFGMIPIGGSSYFLSRLQLEIGTYLALTGTEITGSDAIYLDMAYKHIKFNEKFKLALVEKVNQNSLDFHTLNLYENSLERMKQVKQDKLMEEMLNNTNELANRTNLAEENWIQDRENIKMVMADLAYKDHILAESKRTEIYGKYREFSDQTIMNSHKYFTDQIASSIKSLPKDNFSLVDVEHAINRCFACNSIEEIKQRLILEKEIGFKQWAQKTLDKLNSHSPLALELTLSLLRKAKDLQWHECLQLEYNISSNLARHKDFTEGASKLLSRSKSNPEWSVKHPVSKDLLAEMNNKTQDKLDLGALDHELLPVKSYHEKFPESVRYWMNEISPVNPTRRIDYMFDVKIFMNQHDIDIRDHATQISEIRKAFYQDEEIARKVDDKNRLLDNLSSNEATKRFYIEHRRRAIEEFFSNTQEFEKKLNCLIQNIFQDAFRSRVSTVSETSKQAHHYQFIFFLKDLKDFIARKRTLRNFQEIEAILEAGTIDKKERDELLESIYEPMHDEEFNEMFEDEELKKSDGLYLDQLKCELSDELYIKTGNRNITEAIISIRKGFKFDLEAAKSRRLEVIQGKNEMDYNIYTEDPGKRIYKKLLSEFYLRPSGKDIPDFVYEMLDIRNIQDILQDIEEIKLEKSDPANYSTEEQSQEYRDYKGELESAITELATEKDDRKLINSLVERLDLDEAYVIQAFGNKAYLPPNMTENEELKDSLDEVFYTFDLSEHPSDWIVKTFNSTVKELFDQRFEAEKTMNRQELISYDRGLLQKLTLLNLKNLVLAKLSNEAGLIIWNKAHQGDVRGEGTNLMIQDWKVDLNQDYFNKHMEKVLLNEATSLYNYMKETKEKGKEKTPTPFSDSNENEYQELLSAEFKAGMSLAPLKSEEEYKELWKEQEFVSVDHKYKDYKDSKLSIHNKEKEFREQIKITAGLDLLLENEDIKRQLQNKNTLESVLSSLQKVKALMK